MTSHFTCKIMIGSSLIVIAILIFPVPTVLAQTSPVLPPVAKQLFGSGTEGPNAFRPGPPIPSCNAQFHQGPPDDSIRGCMDSPVKPIQP